MAVTDDKILHVFEVHGAGKLLELSQRSMPKRPCAVQVMPDNATILCGDKFGDVYSLPLIPDDATPTVDDAVESAVSSPPAKLYKPSATNQTVHTQRNRKALEAQMKQKEFSARKEPLKFEHKLLLGHVSMLTDMAFASYEVDGKQRGHIITADRDEHIRISRAPPQAHIIEGYCLGHTEFVSKICPIPGTVWLASGGGDDWIGIWQWPQFELKRKLSLRKAFIDGWDPPSDTQLGQTVAVSGLWIVPMSYQGISADGTVLASGHSDSALVVACEGVAALFVLPVNSLIEALTPMPEGNPLSKPHFWMFRLSHPPVDVTSAKGHVVVSVDNRAEDGQRLHCFRLESLNTAGSDLHLEPAGDLEGKLKGLHKLQGAKSTDKELDELLYGVAKLRKRKGHEEAEAAEVEVEAEAEEAGLQN